MKCPLNYKDVDCVICWAIEDNDNCPHNAEEYPDYEDNDNCPHNAEEYPDYE